MALLEVVVTSVVVGMAVAGIALMFSFGNTWVVAKGDDRIALGLAQQKIEQLRSITFNCIPVFGPGTLGQVRGPNTGCGGITQVFNEGANTWVAASGTAAAAPYPSAVTAGSRRNFTRLTCVQFVSDIDFATPAYAGGTTGNPCVAGATTNSKRITVIVQPAQQTQADPPVILQAWITSVAGGI